jgi:hypothetical protein
MSRTTPFVLRRRLFSCLCLCLLVLAGPAHAGSPELVAPAAPGAEPSDFSSALCLEISPDLAGASSPAAPALDSPAPEKFAGCAMIDFFRKAITTMMKKDDPDCPIKQPPLPPVIVSY